MTCQKSPREREKSHGHVDMTTDFDWCAILLKLRINFSYLPIVFIVKELVLIWWSKHRPFHDETGKKNDIEESVYE